jgi:hypothetical protein
MNDARITRQAVQDVLSERLRQVNEEGFSFEHDDAHTNGQLPAAAASYAIAASVDFIGIVRVVWPWTRDWWKPRDPRRNLVKAGALIIAEIERLDRKAEKERAK